MQNLPGRALVALVALATMFPGLAGAVALDHAPSSPICLGAAAPAPCTGGEPSLSSHAFDYDASGALGATDILTGAQLLLHLWDDKGHGDGSEKIDIVLGEVLLVHNADVEHDVLIELSDLSALDEGWLHVTLTARKGDFFFGGSTLALSVEPAGPGTGGPESASLAVAGPTIAAAVPAPAPLLLLVVSAVALAWCRRRPRRPGGRGRPARRGDPG